jgi:hypothetical protein
VEGEGQERQINLHASDLAALYANFAAVSFSSYEFTMTFAQVEHEVEEQEVPGVVVARVAVAPRLMRELIDAMEDNWSKWSTREGIRNLPESPPQRQDEDED